jgi:hypothetical protein
MTIPPKRHTARLSTPTTTGREQLQRALGMGKAGFKLQLRYILMISQVLNAKPVSNEAPRTINVKQSRLETLTKLSQHLTPAARQQLIQDIQDIADPVYKWSLLAQAITHLPYREVENLVLQIWASASQINNPMLRSGAMFDIANILPTQTPMQSAPTALGRLFRVAETLKNQEARIRGMLIVASHLPAEQCVALLKPVLQELANSKNDSLITKSLTTFAPNIPPALTELTVSVAKLIKQPAEKVRAFTAIAPYLPEDMQHTIRAETLNAIDKIENEEDRADALIGFAPFLEKASKEDFPKLLEQALATTVMMMRRPLRTRMLVSLAPHLATDLQGEALAAVHMLPTERERAVLLAQLAPSLPSNMLVASLAATYTMREQDSRVHALTVLARYVGNTAKQQALQDAMVAASGLPNLNERVRMLVELMDILPDEWCEQALDKALDATRQIDNESARARALNLLGARLKGKRLSLALDMARELKSAEQRLNALLGIVPYLTPEQHTEAVEDLLACVVGMNLEYKRARALVSIATHVTVDDLQQVEALADTLTDPIDGFNVYIALVQNLPPKQRAECLDKAWSLLQRAEVGYDKCTAMSAIAPFIAPQLQGQLMAQVLPTIEAVEDEYDRASAIAILAPLLVNEKLSSLPQADRLSAIQRGLESALVVPYPSQRVALLERGMRLWVQQPHPDRAFGIWQVLVKRLINLPLGEVLQCLGALLPLIGDFGGEEALTEVAQLLGIR